MPGLQPGPDHGQVVGGDQGVLQCSDALGADAQRVLQSGIDALQPGRAVLDRSRHQVALGQHRDRLPRLQHPDRLVTRLLALRLGRSPASAARRQQRPWSLPHRRRPHCAADRRPPGPPRCAHSAASAAAWWASKASRTDCRCRGHRRRRPLQPGVHAPHRPGHGSPVLPVPQGGRVQPDRGGPARGQPAKFTAQRDHRRLDAGSVQRRVLLREVNSGARRRSVAAVPGRCCWCCSSSASSGCSGELLSVAQQPARRTTDATPATLSRLSRAPATAETPYSSFHTRSRFPRPSRWLSTVPASGLLAAVLMIRSRTRVRSRDRTTCATCAVARNR